MSIFPNVFEFTKLGRDQVSKTAIVKTEKDFWKVIKPHFFSNDLDWTYDCDTNEGKIYFGGFRLGGEFKIAGSPRTQRKDGE